MRENPESVASFVGMRNREMPPIPIEGRLPPCDTDVSEEPWRGFRFPQFLQSLGSGTGKPINNRDRESSRYRGAAHNRQLSGWNLPPLVKRAIGVHRIN